MTTTEQLESDDYFEVLGLTRAATESDVRRAYRRLAVLWHPDKNRSPHAEVYFKNIGEAYAVLSDVEQRAQYERYGKQTGSNSSADASGGMDPFGFMPQQQQQRRRSSYSNMAHGGFSGVSARELFDALFAGMDPFDLLGGHHHPTHSRRSSSRQRQRQQQQEQHEEWDPFSGFGFGNLHHSPAFGFGFGLHTMDHAGFGFGHHHHHLQSSAMGHHTAMFDALMGSARGVDALPQPSGFATSSSVRSSSFMDSNGCNRTIKTTTTVDANGHSETLTEEFQNGHLVHSTASSSGGTTNRLASAGRMQLERENSSSSNGNSSSRRARRVRS